MIPTGAEIQAAAPQRVADGEGEADFPDGSAELAVHDQMGPPVRLNEAGWVLRRERGAATVIQGSQDLDGAKQGFVAGRRLERQSEKGR